MSSEQHETAAAPSYTDLAADLQRRLSQGHRLGFRRAVPNTLCSGLQFLTGDSRRMVTRLDELDRGAFRDLGSVAAESSEFLQRRMEVAETSVTELVERLQAFLAKLNVTKNAALESGDHE